MSCKCVLRHLCKVIMWWGEAYQRRKGVGSEEEGERDEIRKWKKRSVGRCEAGWGKFVKRYSRFTEKGKWGKTNREKKGKRKERGVSEENGRKVWYAVEGRKNKPKNMMYGKKTKQNWDREDGSKEGGREVRQEESRIAWGKQDRGETELRD